MGQAKLDGIPRFDYTGQCMIDTPCSLRPILDDLDALPFFSPLWIFNPFKSLTYTT